MPVTREKETTNEAEQQAARITCDALCSLANAPTPRKTLETFEVSINLPVPPMPLHGFHSQATASLAATSPSALTLSPLESETSGSSSCIKVSRTKVKACPKQHQLPLFLSKTYHMIDKCDPAVATWSASGDNFVVKNVEKFASTVLPMYFKHSNFSSFARQLNFYGFRKLRSDPILTNDVDPQTSTYIRFYHEKFQKDRPELLHSIKRATKSDQQSKDDVDELKSQVFKLNKCVLEMSAQMERKICEMNVEYNRRISCMTVEYEKLAGLVSQLLQQKDAQNPAHISLPQSSHHLNHIHYPPLPPVVETTTANTSSATTSVSTDNSGGFTLISDSSGSSSTAKTTTSPSMAIAESSGKQQQKTQSLSKVVASNYVGIASATGAVAPSPSISSMSTIVHGTRTAGKRTASKTLISADSETPKVIKPRISYN